MRIVNNKTISGLVVAQNNAGFHSIQLLCCCFGVDLNKLKFPKDVWFMDAEIQEMMRDVSHYTAHHFSRGLQKWFAFKNNLHARYGRQASFRLFTRSISIRRTSEARYIFSPEPDNFLWKLCNVALLNANRKFQFEFSRTCSQVLFFILSNKTR